MRAKARKSVKAKPTTVKEKLPAAALVDAIRHLNEVANQFHEEHVRMLDDAITAAIDAAADALGVDIEVVMREPRAPRCAGRQPRVGVVQ